MDVMYSECYITLNVCCYHVCTMIKLLKIKCSLYDQSAGHID